MDADISMDVNGRGNLERLLAKVEWENDELKIQRNISNEREAALLREKEEICGALSAKDDVICELQNALLSKEQYIQSLPSAEEFQNHQHKLSATSKKCAQLVQRVAALEKRLAGAKILLKSKDSQCKILEVQKSSLERSNADLLSKLAAELDEVDSVNSLKNTINNLTQANSSLRQLVQEKSEIMDDLRRKYEDKISSVEQKLEIELRQVDAAQAELKEQLTEVEGVQRTVKQLRDEKQELATKNSELQRQVEKMDQSTSGDTYLSEASRELTAAVSEVSCLVKTATIFKDGGHPDTSLVLGTRTLEGGTSTLVTLKVLRREIADLKSSLVEWYASRTALDVDCNIQ